MTTAERRRAIAQGLLSNPGLPQMAEEVGFWQDYGTKAAERARFVASLLDPYTWLRAVGNLPPPDSPEAKRLFRRRGEGLLDVALDWGVNPIAGGLLGTFKGMNANLSDAERDMLAKAFELEQQGLGREAIRQATNPPGGSGGWFRAPWDKKWRMEIDDSAAGVWGMPAERAARKGAPLSGEAARAISVAEDRGLRYRDVLQHPGLYDAYPDFPDKLARVGPMSGGQRGAMERPFSIMALADDLNPGQARSTGLHEIQHAIQIKEGLPRGGSPEMFIRQRSQIDATRKLAEIYERGDDLMEYMRGKGIKDIPIGEAWEGSAAQKALAEYAEWQKIPSGDAEEAMLTVLADLKYPKQIPGTEDTSRLAMDARKRYDDLLMQSILSSEENYRRLAGEAEARLVQARRDLTPAQRSLLDPIEQMDTMLKQEGILGGLDDLIVRYGL